MGDKNNNIKIMTSGFEESAKKGVDFAINSVSEPGDNIKENITLGLKIFSDWWEREIEKKK